MALINSRRWLVVAILVPACLGLLTAAVRAQSDEELMHATAVLRDRDDTVVGQVRFISRGDGMVLVRGDVADVQELEGTFHGFHVHAVGDCSADDFTSAGGHYEGDTDTDHGNHAGDMPPLRFTADGQASLWYVTDQFTVDELLDDDGSAVIVHAGADNLANIPTRYVSTESGRPGPDASTRATGDAGARLACGAVESAPIQ